MTTGYKHHTPLHLTIIGQATRSKHLPLPMLSVQIPAGFPSPADDYVEYKLDLNDLLIKHPMATFFVRAHGDSMQDAGIFSGDLLIVDRALHVTDNCVVVAVVNGEFTVKRLQKRGNRFFLVPENIDYEPMEVTDEMNIAIWGVVKHVIHSL